LPGPASEAARSGWALRTLVLERTDALPGPSFRAEEFRRQTAAGGAAYAFYHSYHTAYVDALLCASLLTRRCRWLDGDDRVDAGARAGLPEAQQVADIAWPGPRSATEDALVALCVPPQAPVGHVETLTEVALIDLAKRYDLVSLRHLLQEIRGSRLENRRSPRGAARFLANQAALPSCLLPPPGP
jgi:hypothetical protein